MRRGFWKKGRACLFATAMLVALLPLGDNFIAIHAGEVNSSASSVFTVSGGTEGTDYIYEEATKTLTILGGTLAIGSKGEEAGNITITGDATVNLDGTQIGILDVQANATLNLQNVIISAQQEAVKIAGGKDVNFNTEGDSEVLAMYGPAFLVDSGATLSFSGTKTLKMIRVTNQEVIASSGDVVFNSGAYEIGGHSSLPVDGGTVTINGGILQMEKAFTNSTTTINAGIISMDNGITYTVYGNQLLPEKLETIIDGRSLLVAHNAILTVPDGKVLTNQGTITVQCGGLIVGAVSGTAEVYENHSYDTEWETNEAGHWYKCTVCGDKCDTAAHKFRWIIDKAASSTADGSKHEACTICGYAKAAVKIPALSGGEETPLTINSVTVMREEDDPANTVIIPDINNADKGVPETGDNAPRMGLSLLLSGGCIVVSCLLLQRKRHKR